jgi:hypothetical protein
MLKHYNIAGDFIAIASEMRQFLASNENTGCGITMPDSYIEPAGQADFPG